ncbi:lipoprotein insertase outer membrane protein LolB [Gallibacterium anatis]|uniref:lipoprotein insertase outer membrane protein LolB n=1 Tax=Gallibacterium anatis TaxID=750 RepID=UPI00254EFD58|nr:lipoprotein insertase outer membrane protein LolB [Gallibacterium anatis]MDK9561601.1 lipoprotein insertase outer membrane protein LolB [Gallibacterium anatis]
MNIKKTVRLSLLSGLTLLFIGCANDGQFVTPQVTLPHNDPVWLHHQQMVNAINHYVAEGQLGYISKKERFSSSFQWQYLDEQHYRLYFSSLLSRSTLTIEKTANNTVIFDNKGNYYADKDIHQLLQDIIGFDFPVEQFPNWLKGLPGNTQNYVVNQQGLLSHFDYQWQNEIWQAKYVNYNQQSPKLPQNLFISSPDKTLKIQIKKWTF